MSGNMRGYVLEVFGLLLLMFPIGAQHLPSRFVGVSQSPESLLSVGVKKGAGLVNRVSVFEDPALGPVTDLRLLAGTSEAPQLVIVGVKGAIFVDRQFAVQRRVAFENRSGQVELIPNRPNGAPRFINRGGGWQPVSFIDSDGKAIWTHGSTVEQAPNNMAATEVDGEGTKFIVGYNGRGGIELLDSNGVSRWNKSDRNVWHVELIREAPDRMSIVHTNANGVIVVRSMEGEILASSRAPTYVRFFSLCPWPSLKEPPRLLFSGDDHVWLATPRGEVLAKFETPDLPPQFDPRGALVMIKNGQRRLAVLASFPLWSRSSLYVFDPVGQIAYYEVLPESCNAIMSDPGVLPSALLIGCQGLVYRYQFAAAH